MKFGTLGKATRPGLVVSPRHDKWMEQNSNPTYTQEALDFGREQLALQAKPRDRRGTYSASSLNTCKRKQQFTFIGLPELAYNAKTAGIFQNGTFMHIRWQMAGLTEGWMARAEVPVPKNDLGLSGTIDGISDESDVIELKSIHTNGFSNVATFGAKEDHIYQAGTYVACTDAERAIFIYEDKNTQEYKEIVLKRSELPIAEITENAQRLWDATDKRKLHEPLSSCEDREGWRYTGCPFRAQCLGIRDWDHAEELARSS